MNKEKRNGIILALCGGIFWGLSGTVGSYIMSEQGIPAMQLSLIRLVAGGLLLVGLSFISYRENFVRLVKNRKDLIQTAVFGVCGLMTCQMTYLVTISYSNSGTATVLQYLGLVLLMLYTCYKEKRRPHVNETLSLVLALFGAFVLVTHFSLSSISISTQGLIWGLASAVALAVYTYLPGGLLREYGSVPVIGLGMLMGGIVVFFISGAWNYSWNFEPFTLLCLAFIVVVGTVLAFCLYLTGVAKIGAVMAGTIACVEPVSATVCSVIIMHTSFGLFDIVGFVLILGAVLILSLGKSEKKS